MKTITELALSHGIDPAKAEALLADWLVQQEPVGQLYTYDGYSELLMPDEVEAENFKENPSMYRPVFIAPAIPAGMVLVTEEQAKDAKRLDWVLHNPQTFEDIFEEVFYESGVAGANDEMRSVVLKRIDAAKEGKSC